MSRRDRGSAQQILAVTLAVVMLVSMGGMAFVGGASAQTGGTADGLLEDETSVASDLGIDSGDGVLTTGDTTIESDGSVTVREESGTQFSGLTVTPDRIGVADDNLATGLNNAVTEVDVEGNATPVVVIEYAPQSNFSQIDDVEGTHDFIVIGNDTALPDDISGTTSDNIVAYSVDNDDIAGNTTELANTSSFDSTIDTIVGSSESDLQNQNVDDFRIGAGTFEDNPTTDPVTVNALQISDDAVEGETIHSELIALDDGTEQRFFNSVTNASAEAGDGDTIDVGTTDEVDTYAALEADPVSLSNNDLTVSGVDDPNLNTNLDVTGNDVRVEGFEIDDSDSGTDGIIDVDGNDVELRQLIVDQQAADDTGINISSGADSTATTVDGVTVTSVDQTNVSQNDTGLALDTNAGEDVSVTNSTFEGHETQIAGNANVDEGTFLSNFENSAAQSAVAQNASGAVAGDAIFGSINAADAENPEDGSIEVSQGTYSHANVVNITTNNVSVTATGSATVTNDLEISGSAGDVAVTGFDVNAASTTAATDLSSLTFNGTAADSFNVGAAAGSVTNATFTSTDTESGAYDVTVGDTVDADGAEGGAFTLNGSSAVDVLGADGDSFTLDSTGDVRVNQTDSAGAVAIGLTEQPEDVTITDGEASNYDIADVAGDVTVTGSETTAGGIDVARSAADIRVDGADVTLDADNQIGVNVTATGDADEVVSIENTAVDGGSTNATGVSMSDVDAGVTAEYTIDGNELTNFDDGVGVNITEEASAGREANISISDNTIAGGSNFVGVKANLSAAENVVIVENEIVGADVSGGAASVGIKFVEAPDFGGGFLGGGDGAEFNNNTITGHARLIEDRSSGNEPPIRSDGYTEIINDLDNDFGTLVIGEDGDFEATYGDDLEINDGTNGVVYLPGSIDQAVELVGDSPNVESAELQVYEPDVTVPGVTTPNKYDDDPVVFPDADDITVTGESDTIEAETTFEITGGDRRNNHDIRSLTIESDGTAISVSTTKAQSEFTDLDVTATGTGVDVDPNGTDVNVIEVRESEFTVEADGIDFAGTPDDRDGFVIDTVEVTGAGIGAGDTGLDLSGVEKPGKAGLPVNLTVTGATVTDFSTQVAVGDNITADADDFLNDNTTASVTIQGNEFGQAIRVVDDNDDLTDDDLYGSVNAADAAASNGDTIDVLDVASAATRYAHGDEVTLETANVTLTGPAVADSGSATDDDVVIEDQIRATDTTATVQELVVDTENSSAVLNGSEYGANPDAGETAETIVGADANVNLTVQNATVTTTLGSAHEGVRPVGIGAATDGSTATLDVNNVFVGGDSSGIGTGVVAQENVALSIEGSDLRAGANGIDAGGNLVSEGYGVLAGPDTAPTISETQIDGFDADGVNTVATDVELDGGAVTNNNAAGADSGVGGVATNADIGSSATEYTITDTNISANDGVGVTLTGVGLDADGVTVSDNGGDGVDVTGDDVVIDGASTIANNGATGALLEVTNATVTNSNLSASSTGADIEATNVTVERTVVSGNDADGVIVDAETAAVVDNTIEQATNGAGLTVELDDSANSSVTQNALRESAFGLNVTTGADDLTVTGNTFDDNTDTDIQNNADGTLDATLNHFGTQNGPESTGAAGVTENVVYDPFLTTDQRDESVDAISETENFGHDVVIPAGETVSVGFPAAPNSARNEVSDVFDPAQPGAIFRFNTTTKSFEQAEMDDTITAFDGYVVDNTGGDATALIEYQTPAQRGSTQLERTSFDQGLNFVPPQQAGTVDEALFPGGETDFVAQPFATGENLYGDVDAAQSRDAFVDPSADGFNGNFRGGVGDEVVHPHAAYLVIVNENTNDELTVAERIPTPDTPTADNVAERTDGDDTAATNLNTGEEFENLQIAFAEADDGDRIRLGTGILEVDPDGISDELVIDNSNLTVFGAGDGATTIEGGNVTVAGDDNVLTDFQVRGANLNTDGNNNDVSGVSVTSASPGGAVIVDGNNNAFSDVNVETLTITNNADSTDVNRAVVGTFDDSGTGTTTTDVSQARVVVDDATELREAANGTTDFVNADTTIVIDETIDLGGTTADVTVDGVTIRGAGTVENASTLFDVTTSGVTLEDVTLNASANTGVNLDLSAGDSVTISDTTLSVTSGTALDASNTDASIDATIEENAFEADSDDNARYVDDENDVLDLAAIQNDNEFPETVVLVEGNSDFALTSTIQGGVNAAENTDGDTVSVSAGTYDESVTVDVEGLTLEAADGASPTVENNGQEPTIVVESDDVTIDGVDATLTDDEMNDVDQGIRVAGSGTTVTDLTITQEGSVSGNGFPNVGILVTDQERLDENRPDPGTATTDVTIDNVDVTGFADGSENGPGSGILIATQAAGPDEGVGVDNVTITGGTISDNDQGIALFDQNDGSDSAPIGAVTINGVTTEDNDVGVSVATTADSEQPTIENMEFNQDAVFVSDFGGANPANGPTFEAQLDLDAILNDQGNEFDPDGEVDGNEIVQE